MHILVGSTKCVAFLPMAAMADGTFLVSRYLQITSMTPQATSVILDGVVSTSGGEQPNGRMTFDKWSIGFEQV